MAVSFFRKFYFKYKKLIFFSYGDNKPLSQPSLQHTPLFWWSGFRLLLLSAATGTKRIFIKNFTLENVLKAIHTYKPIWVAIAPSTVAALLNHPEFKNYDVRSIKLLLLGGSAVSEHLRSRIKVSNEEIDPTRDAKMIYFSIGSMG